MTLSSRTKNVVIAILTAISLALLILLSLRVHLPASSDFDLAVVDLPDDAPADRWMSALAAAWQEAGEIPHPETPLSYRGKTVTLTAFDQDLHASLLKAYLSAKDQHRAVALAVICTSKFSYADLEHLRALHVFARENNITLLPVTNSSAVATLFLFSPRRTLIFPWVIALVVAGGIIGGFIFALTQAVSFKCIIPFSGRKIDTGFAGYVAIGGGAGIVLVALAVKSFGLDLDPLFKWPYEAESARALLQTLAVAIVGGYMGITLLNKVSEGVLKRLQDQIEAQDAELADSLALSAKALYASNFSADARIKSADIRKDVTDLAERSNAKRPNALAMAMLAEVRRMENDLPGAVAFYDRAIALLPDKNVRNPHDLHFNRACALSGLQDPKNTPTLVASLQEFLKSPEARTEDILNDADLAWARSQPEVKNSFPFLTAPPPQPSSKP